MNLKLTLEKNFNKLFAIGLFIGVCAVATSIYYYVYTRQMEQDRQHASQMYESLLDEIALKQSTDLEKKAEAIITQYPKTVYAALSKLYLAKNAVEKNALEKAVKLLMDVAHSATDVDLQSIARHRSARVLSQMQHYKQALDVLNHPICQEDLATCEEIKGDILLAQGQTKAALKAYQTAKANLIDELEFLHPLLQIKLDNLGNLSDINA